MKIRQLFIGISILCFTLFIMGCTSHKSASVTPKQVIKQYSDIVYANYQDSLNAALTLQESISQFVESPSPEKLEAAKTAWLLARIPYSQSEGYRFYSGPIDDEDGLEGRLNAWPLDEAYIDYVNGNRSSGIINRTKSYPKISKPLLIKLNEKGGDKNISTGFHAIEFLLWGQDLTEGPGAGERAYTDYVSAKYAKRRANYLIVVTQLLVDDLTQLVNAWAPDNPDNYRSWFEKLPVKDALSNILRGAGTLSASELSAERLAAPLDIGEREEEQSCFSDNTRDDAIQNTQSIANILRGSYLGIDGRFIQGASVLKLIQVKNPKIAARIEKQLVNTIQFINDIQDPFDQEIRPTNPKGNQRVQLAIDALQKLGSEIQIGAKVLGIELNVSL